MQGTLETIYQTPDGGSDNIDPPIYTAVSDGDGEGDGRLVAEGLDKAEAYANYATIIELGGVSMARTVYGHDTQPVLRNRMSIPTGRLALRRSMPTFIS